MAKSSDFLMDTHIFIWWMERNSRLSQDIVDLLSNPYNTIFLSVISIWEMVLKKQIKKLKLSRDITVGVKASGFTVLPLELSHVLGIERLPFLHKDPFDRLLIAQACVEDLIILTEDAKIKQYDVKIL